MIAANNKILKGMEIKSLEIKDRNYPYLLKEIPNPPDKIFFLGEFPNEKKPKIAIVGTRKATNEGKILAQKWAKELSENGFIVVSGLAMGIDTAAHEGAIKTNGQTIAVLGNGLDEIYPAQNQHLAEKILELKGTIISEYPIGTPAFPSQFLERNRIVSGLCQAVIVIEAPIKSGALVTARLAAEQGREVFITPGPINHPNYQGSHKLIRDGARLITSLEDIFDDLNIDIEQLKQNKQLSTNIKDEKQLIIWETVKNSGQPLSIDKIIESTKLDPQTVNQSIAILIIEGILKEDKGKYSI